MKTVTEVVQTVRVDGLDDAFVTAVMDEACDLAALADDILEWSVSSDLPASVLTVELVVDSADVTVGERRAIEALGRIVGSAQFTVTRRAAELVA